MSFPYSSPCYPERYAPFLKFTRHNSEVSHELTLLYLNLNYYVLYMLTCSNDSRIYACFDSTMIWASKNFEETIISPILIPRVSTQPVWGSIFNTPSDYLDSVTTKFITSSVFIDSWFVGEEILVHSEGSLEYIIEPIPQLVPRSWFQFESWWWLNWSSRLFLHR